MPSWMTHRDSSYSYFLRLPGRISTMTFAVSLNRSGMPRAGY